MIDWVYAQQLPTGLFKGGPMLNGSEANLQSSEQLELGHLANTYTALCLLIVSGDYTLSKVNKKGLLQQLGKF